MLKAFVVMRPGPPELFFQIRRQDGVEKCAYLLAQEFSTFVRIEVHDAALRRAAAKAYARRGSIKIAAQAFALRK